MLSLDVEIWQQTQCLSHYSWKNRRPCNFANARVVSNFSDSSSGVLYFVSLAPRYYPLHEALALAIIAPIRGYNVALLLQYPSPNFRQNGLIMLGGARLSLACLWCGPLIVARIAIKLHDRSPSLITNKEFCGPSHSPVLMALG